VAEGYISKDRRTMIRFDSFFKLGLLSSLISCVGSFSIDENASSLSLGLMDTETNISPVSLLFTNKKTSVTVNGLAWTGEANENSESLNYVTYLNDKEVHNGSFEISDSGLKLPSSIETGVVVAEDSGSVTIRVILDDGSKKVVVEKSELRVYRSWAAAIPIVCAFGMFLLLRMQLTFSLFTAMFLGSWIIEGSLILGFRAVFEKYIVGSLSDSSHVSILLFVISIYVFMEMVNKSGGTNEAVRYLSPYTTKARIAQLAVLGMGIFTFFDPYASILIVGKVFVSVMSGFPISSAKLSLLVDITALPVSSIIPGSSWFVLVTSLVQNGIDIIQKGEEDESSLVHQMNGKTIVLSCVKYQFYSILILVMISFQLLFGREAGPMLKAENGRRRDYGIVEQELVTTLSDIKNKTSKSERLWNWFVPVIVLNILLWVAFIRMDVGTFQGGENLTYVASPWLTSTATAILLVYVFFSCQSLRLQSLKFWRKRGEKEGMSYIAETFPSGSTSIPYAPTDKSHKEISHIDDDFGPTSSCKAIDEGSLKEHKWSSPTSSILSVKEGMECFYEGISKSMPLIASLIVAWSTSDVYIRLGIGRIATGWVVSDDIPQEAEPIVAFFSAFVLSLVLGSSWLSVSILIPGLTFSLAESNEATDEDFALVLASLLSGAIAGHVSPFSETSILSAFVSGCDVHNHFMTQVPYVSFVLLLSILVGTTALSYAAYTVFIAFFIGIVGVVGFVVLFCRQVQKPKFSLGRGAEAITQNFHIFPRLAKTYSESSHYRSNHLAKASSDSSHHRNIGLIMPVKTEDLIDSEENQYKSSDEEKREPIMPSEIEEANSECGDPVLGLLEDGLIATEIENTLSKKRSESRKLQRDPSQSSRNGSRRLQRDPSESTKFADIKNKKRLIEATIKSAENEGNFFSESLRMFLGTESKFDEHITNDESLKIQDSESGDSGDDSLDNLVSDIAAKGWKSALEDLEEDEDGVTAASDTVGGYSTSTSVEGDTTAGGYTTTGEYTTDGLGSVMEESDDSASVSATSATTSSSAQLDQSSTFGQSTAFTTINSDQSFSHDEATSTSTSQGPSVSASEATSVVSLSASEATSTWVDPQASKSRKAFAQWIDAADIASKASF